MIGTICKNCGCVCEWIDGDKLCDTCTQKIDAYKEKIENKIDYATDKASQLKESSDEFFSKGFCERTGIPFGQPILVGHHSERRHRNVIARYENQVRKNLDDHEKSKYYEEKAKRLENNTVISSDDPEAVRKLKDKITSLEEKRQRIKQLKKEGKEFPHYVLPYISQDIRRLKQRIQHLENIMKIDDKEEMINGVTLKIDKDSNRVKLFFEGKPEDEIRTKLKSHGFRWSPYNGCWQRQISDWAIEYARDIAQAV